MSEWISVKERLPEKGMLIVYANKYAWGCQYGVRRACGSEQNYDYWMLLPDPPEEG